jgi:parallel beta-helix repeat protein
MNRLILVLILMALVIPCQAQTITVDDDGPADFDSIQAAIDYSWHGDIIIVKPGTYNENVSFSGRALTLTSEDPNDPAVVESTMISVESGYGVTFDFDEGNESVLTGFTITGRGIYCYASSPTISKNVIKECNSRGIYGREDAAPIISHNTISSNQGRAIDWSAGPVTNNIIQYNDGAISWCSGPILNNIISNNVDQTGGYGGALYYCNGEIANNVIVANFAPYRGGALYECDGYVHDNVIVANNTQMEGGGLSHCDGNIVNNIIAGNRAHNGGGLWFCRGHILNNSIVGNRAHSGAAINDSRGVIQNNVVAFNAATDVGGIYGLCDCSYNCFWKNTGGNFGGGAEAGPGDIMVDPLFAINGYWDANNTPDEADDFWVDGDYHLKSEAGRWNPKAQIWLTDGVTSLCVDAGNPDSDWTAELWPHGRRINIGAYGGTAQASMSLSDAGNAADLNHDSWVDYNDMVLLTKKWLYDKVPLAEDLDRDGVVNFSDFAVFVGNWHLAPPIPTAPTPDPMTWATSPYATSAHSIAMVATTAVSTDGSGAEYYFEDYEHSEYNSGWLSFEPDEEPFWEDTDLASGTLYWYRVKARNKTNLMETEWSQPASAMTFPEDTIAPTPDPATWATQPYVSAPKSIRMVATTASDPSGVEYYFECTSHPVYNSGWQDSPVYEVADLPKGFYSFVVRARDKSPNQNTTGDSVEVTVDLVPPTPDPMQWAVGGEPREVHHGSGNWDYWAEMTATEATDESGTVLYYFRCTTEGDFSSGWQSSQTYKVPVGRENQRHRFRVKARDLYGNETGWSLELPTIP